MGIENPAPFCYPGIFTGKQEQGPAPAPAYYAGIFKLLTSRYGATAVAQLEYPDIPAAFVAYTRYE